MTAKNEPTIRLLPVDKILRSDYQITEPFGLVWEKHLVKRITSFGTSYFIVSKLGDETQKLHKSYKVSWHAESYYVRLEMI